MHDYPDIPWVDLGYLDARAAINLQQSSQINLLLSWATRQSSGILTSKLYQYLAAQRPILALVEGNIDTELNYLITEVNGGFCHYTFYSQPELLEDWLSDRYQEWSLTQMVKNQSDFELVKDYTWEKQIKTWLTDLQYKDNHPTHEN